MRWIAGLVALGLTMALFNIITAAGPLEARATLALGFLLLAAALGGGIAARTGLPRITGFLVAGVVAGPEGLDLVRADEVGALRFLSDAALTLIAFGAGSEVKLEQVRRHGRALVGATAGALLFPLLAVAAFVLLVSPWFPLTVQQPWSDRLTIALALGCLAAGSSPAVTKAMMDELGAHGPFPRLLLALTIAKDFAVVVVMTLILVLGIILGSSGSLDPHVLWGTPLLGLVVWLVSLAAGCVVTNVTRPESDALLRVLRRGAHPVYALAFVLAGAGLHLDALEGIWVWVLAVAGLRALGLRYGLRWAGRDVSVPPNLAQYGWLGLVSQAGVVLGLATVVRRVFPEWGVSLEAFVLAMIGVHEVFGPVLLRRAVQHAGAQEGRNAEPDRSDSIAGMPRMGVR